MTWLSCLKADAKQSALAAQYALAVLTLAACSPPPRASTVSSDNAPADGAALYEQSCAMCHFNGADSQAAPPLIGSAMVRDHPRALIAAIVDGMRNTSVVNGKKFGGIMPATAGLSDAEIAAVVTFVRQRYGGATEVTTAAEVAATH
ncbi:MAG: cytochrome c [Terrimicrobiaceae bacterium]|nr:cytochrome c [Terrimicrobiaceae bacterium]